MSNGLSELEILRREALAELRKLGIDPYPPEAFEVNVNALDIINRLTPVEYDPNPIFD